jgi:hypothetical protein
MPCDREVSTWQGRIANAAQNGSGLDVYLAALTWAKQDAPPDNGVREKAKQEIREAAERHLADLHGLRVIEAIYGAAFPVEADDGLASNDKLGAATVTMDDRAEIERLAKLTRMDYARTRKDAAKRLRVKVTALDQVVGERRKQADESATLPYWQVEPWPDAVTPAALLDSIVAVFNRYIVLPKYAAEALALWILHAWTFDAGDISPFVVLTSPTKRCGKTSVLILLNWLTPRSELASNISPSAIFRYIEEQQPCLLIDEADSFLKSSEEARGILNSGHTKAAAYVIRNVEMGGDHKPQRFSTWSPKVIASIGGLAGTLEDRAIVIPMQRKPKGPRLRGVVGTTVQNSPTCADKRCDGPPTISKPFKRPNRRFPTRSTTGPPTIGSRFWPSPTSLATTGGRRHATRPRRYPARRRRQMTTMASSYCTTFVRPSLLQTMKQSSPRT